MDISYVQYTISQDLCRTWYFA